MKKLLLFLGIYLISSVLYAGNTNSDGLESVPELPDTVETGEKIEPRVTILRKEGAIVEEYRLNGLLYMVKVTPAIGPPYYLLDNDGDGYLETRRSELDNPIIPQWILLTW